MKTTGSSQPGIPKCLTAERYGYELTKSRRATPVYWAHAYADKNAASIALHPCDPITATRRRDAALWKKPGAKSVATDNEEARTQAEQDEHERAIDCANSWRLYADVESPPTFDLGRDAAIGPSVHATAPAANSEASSTAPAREMRAPMSDATPSFAQTEKSPMTSTADEEAQAESLEETCRDNRIFVQFGPTTSLARLRYVLKQWETLGEHLAPVENVWTAARAAGRAPPPPVTRDTILMHDLDTESARFESTRVCIEALVERTPEVRWAVRPLPAGLRPQKGAIEVWLAPGL